MTETKQSLSIRSRCRTSRSDFQSKKSITEECSHRARIRKIAALQRSMPVKAARQPNFSPADAIPEEVIKVADAVSQRAGLSEEIHGF
jgi:hypothetical protein